MADRFDGLPEREGRDVPRGDRVDGDPASDLALREDPCETVPRDLPDGVVVRRFGELLRTLHPDVHDPSPMFPAHVRQRRPDRVEHAVDFRPQYVLPVGVRYLREVLPITLPGNVLTTARRAITGFASAEPSPARMDLPARSVGPRGRVDFGG